MTTTILDRFLSKVSPLALLDPNSCWNWTGYRNAGGYGTFGVAGKSHLAHRLSYELFVGPIPPGMHVCHSCDNPRCVNFRHLWLGTNADNMRDRGIKGRCNAGIRQKEKTHCPQGHEFTPENTYLEKCGKYTKRQCRICRRNYCREWAKTPQGIKSHRSAKRKYYEGRKRNHAQAL